MVGLHQGAAVLWGQPRKMGPCVPHTHAAPSWPLSTSPSGTTLPAEDGVSAICAHPQGIRAHQGRGTRPYPALAARTNSPLGSSWPCAARCGSWSL